MIFNYDKAIDLRVPVKATERMSDKELKAVGKLQIYNSLIVEGYEVDGETKCFVTLDRNTEEDKTVTSIKVRAMRGDIDATGEGDEQENDQQKH